MIESCHRGCNGTIQETKMLDTKIVHTSGKVFDFGGLETIRFVGSKNVEQYLLSMFPYTENTRNPNLIFKITIYCTQYPQNAKILSNIWKKLETFETVKFFKCLF